MRNNPEHLRKSDLTDKIIQAFYAVYNTLGYGFLEKVYETALIHELIKMGITAIPQSSIQVLYDGKVVGDYFADILVNGCIIIEIKAVRSLSPEHGAQPLNYFKATNIEIGLLLNFGPKPEVKRKIYDNSRK